MRKSIKNFITMLLIVLGIFQMSAVVFAEITIPNATSEFYVNDFSNVFSKDEKSRLLDNAITLSKEHNDIQIVVSTVKSLDGNTIEDYAFKMYNQYEIGKDDMGLLILLSTGDRQIRVEVGKAMEAYINDGKAGDFIDKYAIPYLKDNKFNEGLINLQEALISEIVTCIESEENQVTIPNNSEIGNASNLQNTHSDAKDSSKVLNIILICILITIFIVVLSIVGNAIAKKIKQVTEMKKKIAELSTELETLKSSYVLEKQQIIEEYQKEKSELCEKSVQEKNNLSHNFEQEKEKLSEQLNISLEKNEQVKQDYQKLENNFLILQDRYERVNKLHPNADNEVSKMIEDEIKERDMQKAQNVDSLIYEVINLSPNKDIIDRFQSALSAYSCLSEKQKSFVTSDISKLQKLHNKSVELKREYEKKIEEERICKRIAENKESANNALQSITAIISSISIGTADNLNELKRAQEIYSNLSYEVRKYFDDSVSDKVDKLLREAQSDYDKKQEIKHNKKLAAAAVASITAIIAYISYGKAKDLKKLKEAKKIYENLDSASQKYVDTSVIEKLDRLIREAQRDKEEEEAERRRKEREEEHRRRMQSNSYSSFDSFSHHSGFGSSSHHSGFGGHSGGGGASRGF